MCTAGIERSVARNGLGSKKRYVPRRVRFTFVILEMKSFHEERFNIAIFIHNLQLLCYNPLNNESH